MPPTPQPAPDTPGVVLDSNVVFDWLVFGEARVQPLVRAITAGQLRWLMTEAMLDELGHVLGRGALARWRPDAAQLLATCQGLAWRCEARPTPGAGVRLRCRDGDDQKFIDLALAEQARWLISRDKAVLALARRARPLGVSIVTPEAWGSARGTG